MKKFISKVRNSEPAVRKIWLVVFSAAAMAVIVGLWAVYANNRISKISRPLSGAAQITAQSSPKDGASLPAEASAEAGPLEIFAAGLKTIFGGLKEKIGKSNSVTIEKPNFTLENLKTIPKTNLP